MKDQTELEALQAKYDALSTEYHLIRKVLRTGLSDEQNVAHPGSVDKIRFLIHERETDQGAIRIQASQIENLMTARDAVSQQYSELVDALCSKALELEDVALAAGYCIRKSGHDGPCNGLPRNDCPQGDRS